ncbi:hypothetical protein H6503_05075 [Candidatus Woesearchaeota archaeon]|nr:hypothetical protein [Candidatus Woesearchaeota archaeon]
MEKTVDTIDTEGRLQGKDVSLEKVLLDGTLHKVGHLWILNEFNRILLREWKDDNPVYGHKWDVSVHKKLAYRDDPPIALADKSARKIGVSFNPLALIPLGIWDSYIEVNGYKINERIFAFLGKWNGSISDVKVDEDTRFMTWVPMENYQKERIDLDRSKIYVAHGHYDREVLHAIQRYL